MSSLTSDAIAINIFRAQRAAAEQQQGGERPSTAADVYDPTLDRVREVRPTLPAIVRPEVDARLLAILDARGAIGETVYVTYARKEQELGAVFATLPALEAMVMHRRLSEPQPGDELAEKFARLVVDRRSRLLAFLADARRREARRRR